MREEEGEEGRVKGKGRREKKTKMDRGKKGRREWEAKRGREVKIERQRMEKGRSKDK